MLNVLSYYFLRFEAVVCNDHCYCAIKTADAAQQDFQCVVAEEGLSGDGDLRVDVWEKEEINQSSKY